MSHAGGHPAASPRWRRLALVAGALVLLTSCRLSIAVNVDVRDDGSGVVQAIVTLDKEAADRLKAAGGALEADDLRKAGWTVTKSATRIVASKPFKTPSELTAVIDEVAGPRHPLRDFELTRTRTAFRTDTKFSGLVDLTAGVNAFSDDRLREQTGLDLADLERRGDFIINQIFSVQVGVRLPGDVSSNAPTDAANGAVWRPKLGERAALSASGSELDTRRIVFVAIAVTAGLGLVLQVVRTMRRHGQGKDTPPLH